MTRRRAARVFGAGFVAILAGALAGHAHLAASGSACPASASTSPVALEHQRVRAMAPLAGTRTGARLDVGPHVLQRTTRAELVRSEEDEGAACAVELGGAAVRCEARSALGTWDELVARFDDEGRLVALDRVRYGLEGTRAEALLGVAVADAEARWGAPSRSWGEPRATFLASPLRQAGYSWHLAEVVVDVTATRLGAKGREGLVLRVQHRAVGRAG